MPIGDFHHHHTLYIMYASRFKSPKNLEKCLVQQISRGLMWSLDGFSHVEQQAHRLVVVAVRGHDERGDAGLGPRPRVAQRAATLTLSLHEQHEICRVSGTWLHGNFLRDLDRSCGYDCFWWLVGLCVQPLGEPWGDSEGNMFSCVGSQNGRL